MNLPNILLELMATSSSQRLAEGRASEFLLVPSVVVPSSGPNIEIFTPILESISNLRDHFLVSVLCKGLFHLENFLMAISSKQPEKKKVFPSVGIAF